MAIQLTDNQLDKIIKNNPKKLVCVDFSSETCGPCKAAQPFWDSLPAQYPTCLFYIALCEKCSSDASKMQVKATPTFVFFLRGSEIGRVKGCDRKQIQEIIEKNKPSGDFAGQGRSLGNMPSQDDFFANFSNHQQQGPRPAQQTPKSQEKRTPPVVPQNFIPNPKQVEEDLRAMSFNDDQIRDVISHLGKYANLDDCVKWLYEKQAQSQSLPKSQTQDSSQAPPESAPQTGPTHVREFNENETAMLENLLDMGFEQELAAKAVLHCGPDSIDQCVDYLAAVQEGRDPGPPRNSVKPAQPVRSKEEIEAQVNLLRERSKQKELEKTKIEPKLSAQSELERRKQVQEQLEARKKYEEMKKEQEARQAQKEMMADRIARDKIKAKIAAQRASQKSQSGDQSQLSATPQPQVSIPSKAPPTQCVLKCMIVSNGTSKILNLSPTDTLRTVDAELRKDGTLPSGARTVFETIFPRAVITGNQLNQTLQELQLAPRGQINVKYQ